MSARVARRFSPALQNRRRAPRNDPVRATSLERETHPAQGQKGKSGSLKVTPGLLAHRSWQFVAGRKSDPILTMPGPTKVLYGRAVLRLLLEIYQWIVLLAVLGSWLGPNRGVAQPFFELLDRLTEPVLKPIRKLVPPVGGLDLSPMILLLGLLLLRRLV